MSTVPEALVARQLGLRVAALSGITNAAAGLGMPGAVLSHAAVLKQADSPPSAAIRLVTAFVRSRELTGLN